MDGNTNGYLVTCTHTSTTCKWKLITCLAVLRFMRRQCTFSPSSLKRFVFPKTIVTIPLEFLYRMNYISICSAEYGHSTYYLWWPHLREPPLRWSMLPEHVSFIFNLLFWQEQDSNPRPISMSHCTKPHDQRGMSYQKLDFNPWQNYGINWYYYYDQNATLPTSPQVDIY